jgi:hypothetical protein
LLVAVAVALAVCALAACADQRSRADESRALDACRRQLHDTAVSSDLQMMAVATTIHPPSASRSGRAYAGLAGIMSRSARQLLPDLVGAEEACRGVSLRPWHFSLRSERDAATAYAGALTAKLRAVATDGRTSYLDDATLRSLRQAADLEEFGGRS